MYIEDTILTQVGCISRHNGDAQSLPVEDGQMWKWAVEAPAKINLSLDALERLPNGYHRLAMLMQTVGLTDGIRLEERPSGIVLSCGESAPRLPTDSGNLAWKAAAAFFERYPGHGGVHISLAKRIPVAAGLAGGSTDAAAVLMGLNRVHGSPFSPAELSGIGVGLGADVPFCLIGGTCLAGGIGEILTPMPSFKGFWLVLVKPPFSISTPWAFARLRLGELGKRPDTAKLVELIAKRDLAGVAGGMENVLEQVAMPFHPEIGHIREWMLRLGALGSRMSGSGPSVFGFFKDEQAARAAHERISPVYPGCWVVQTVDGPYEG
jgi:4-diphosphocytidyl-2-C-methyl-D-erythritol kinase